MHPFLDRLNVWQKKQALISPHGNYSALFAHKNYASCISITTFNFAFMSDFVLLYSPCVPLSFAVYLYVILMLCFHCETHQISPMNSKVRMTECIRLGSLNEVQQVQRC